MKQLKRILALLVGLTLLFTGVDWTADRGATAYAEGMPTQNPETIDENPDELLHMGEWIYWVKDGQAVVAGYEDKGVTTLSIPAHLGGYPVTGIGREAFSTNTVLQSIQIPTNVTRIADNAFSGLMGLSIKAYNGAYALKYASRMGFSGHVVGRQSGADYAEGMIDLAGLPSGSYSNLNDSSVVFKANEATFLTEGQVVYFPKSAAYPTGFARKIDSITPSGDQLYVTLSQPEWGEAFERVHGEEELILDWNHAVYSDAFEVNDVSASKLAAEAKLEIKTKLGSRDLKGSVTIGIDKPTVKYDVGWRWWGILRIPSVDLVDVTIPVTTKLELEYGETFKTNPQRNGQGRIMNRKTIPFGSIPAMSVSGAINGYISIDFVVDISGSISISATYKNSVNIRLKNGKITKTVTPISKDYKLDVEAELKMGPKLSFYVVLGWGGFSIRFFEITAGVYLKASGSISYTKVSGSELMHMCGDIKVTIDAEASLKIGLIKLAGWDINLSLNLNFSITILTILNGHFDDGQYVGPSGTDKCTLKNRQYKITSDGKTASSGKTDVNKYLTEPGSS